MANLQALKSFSPIILTISDQSSLINYWLLFHIGHRLFLNSQENLKPNVLKNKLFQGKIILYLILGYNTLMSQINAIFYMLKIITK